MKKYFCVIIGLILLFPAESSAQIYTVKKVIEGDILELSDGRTVHLIGIDAPDSTSTARAKMFAERSGKKLSEILAVGKKAKKFAQKLVEGKQVRLEYDLLEIDEQGKIWAYVYMTSVPGKDGGEAEYFLSSTDIFVNATIVKSGYASPVIIPPNIKHSRLFKQLFTEAQLNKRGLWKNSTKR